MSCTGCAGGSAANCGDTARSAKLYYDCYCDEHRDSQQSQTLTYQLFCPRQWYKLLKFALLGWCDSCATEPSWNTTSLWWGEFQPCVYSAYLYSPLACQDKIG